MEINDEDLGGLMYIRLAEGEVLYPDKTGAREAPDLSLTAYPVQHGNEKKAG